jgi:hypothetical protein
MIYDIIVFMRTDILDRKSEILDWIANNDSKASICKRLKCKPDTLERYLKILEVEYKGNMGSKGKKSKIGYLTAIEYLSSGSYIKSHKLKCKMLMDGLKPHECEVCGTKEWNGKPVPLELDHIDGDHFNNELGNLRIICPNCHAQTDTNSGKNVGKNKRM